MSANAQRRESGREREKVCVDKYVLDADDYRCVYIRPLESDAARGRRDEVKERKREKVTVACRECEYIYGEMYIYLKRERKRQI